MHYGPQAPSVISSRRTPSPSQQHGLPTTYLFSDFLLPQVEKGQKRDWVPSVPFDTSENYPRRGPTHTHTCTALTHHKLTHLQNNSQDAHFPGIPIGLGSRKESGPHPQKSLVTAYLDISSDSPYLGVLLQDSKHLDGAGRIQHGVRVAHLWRECVVSPF